MNPGPPSTPVAVTPPCHTQDVLNTSEDLPIGARGRGAATAEVGEETPTAAFEGVFAATWPAAPQAKKRKQGPGRRGQPGAPAKRSKRPKKSAGTVSGSSRKGGRRAGTSVIDGISAVPLGEEGTAGSGAAAMPSGGEGTGSGAAPAEPSGERDQGEASQEGAQEPGENVATPSESGVRAHMSHEEQRAQANWTAAIMKVDELKPKSYKDYVRALRTYKVGEQPFDVLANLGSSHLSPLISLHCAHLQAGCLKDVDRWGPVSRSVAFSNPLLDSQVGASLHVPHLMWGFSSFETRI